MEPQSCKRCVYEGKIRWRCMSLRGADLLPMRKPIVYQVGQLLIQGSMQGEMANTVYFTALVGC